MNATLAATRTGKNGSSELWYVSGAYKWLMYGFVNGDAYKIDLERVEERHNYGDMFSEGKIPDCATKIEMSPVAALIYK